MPAAILVFCLAAGLRAQVYSPRTRLAGQPDASDLRAFAAGIVAQARAGTPREKAEAIWRFFLTNAKFSPSGFWYHAEGWAEEPVKGEVIDPIKLLNSYGFGLCSHIATLLEAVYDAAGFEDSRIWYLGGHVVAEVFYEGAYHYFDSDMMGYNLAGGDVAGVQDVAADAGLLLRWKPERKRGADPHYTDLSFDLPSVARLFTSTGDNWLFPFPRYSLGHGMDMTLRPGERLIRYFGAEDGRFYLPFRQVAGGWKELPEQGRKPGPYSRVDDRVWGTGRLEYRPPLWERSAYFASANIQAAPGDAASISRAPGGEPAFAVFDIRSPYVLIDAHFSMDAVLSKGDELRLETSTDGGRTWDLAGSVTGPFRGAWKAEPREIARSANGRKDAVSGSYGYLARLTLAGAAPSAGNLLLLTRFQWNPRSGPALRKGPNELIYEPGPQRLRWEVSAPAARFGEMAFRNSGMAYAKLGTSLPFGVSEIAEGALVPKNGSGEVIYEIAAPDGSPLTGADFGGRFLDLRDSLSAPPGSAGGETAGALEWSLAPEGPYTVLWSYDPELRWKDGRPVTQLARWPEVYREVRRLPPGARRIYVKYKASGMAVNDIRLAAIADPAGKPSSLEVVHVWFDGDKEQSHVERIDDPAKERRYVVNVPGKAKFRNYGVILSCPAPPPPR